LSTSDDGRGPAEQEKVQSIGIQRYHYRYMDVVALGARLVLSLVFVVAAAGKLANLNRTRRTLVDFRVPRRLVRPVAWLLPLGELSVAAALLVGLAARWGAIAAATLLLLFIAGIVAAMSRGEAPDCNCFGQIGSAPAGWKTLVRNTALGAIALLVIVRGPGTDPGPWLTRSIHGEILIVVLGISTVALAAAVVGLWRERRTLLIDLANANRTLASFGPGLPVGAVAPAFALPTASGETMSLDSLRERGRPVALVFASPSCRSCRYMLSDIARWQRTLSDSLTICVIANASAEGARAMADEFDLSDVMYQGDQNAVFRAYRATATPSVVIVSPEGRIATRIRSSQGVVENTIRSAIHTVASSAATNGHSASGGDELDSARLVVGQWAGGRA
jgi:uncharacterized membrane protein YphA (DoxX/SURF4 family)/peroxiredoxin